MTMPHAAITTELILGGQKSGKSRRAELLARQWLGQGVDHRAVLIATAQPWESDGPRRAGVNAFGFGGINAHLIGYLPGLEQGQAEDLMLKAHQVCPYSKATRGNIDVTLAAKV